MSRKSVRSTQEQEAQLTDLDAAIASGIASADAGRIKPAAEVFDRMNETFQSLLGVVTREALLLFNLQSALIFP
jgi:hypothetical protein